MVKDPEELASLRRGRKRGLWVLLVSSMATVGSFFSPYPGVGALLLVLVIPAVVMFLVATQSDFSQAAKGEELPDMRVVGKPLRLAIGWVAVAGGIPLVIILAGGWYGHTRNSDYEMFAVGDRLGEIMNAVDDYYVRHGRLP